MPQISSHTPPYTELRAHSAFSFGDGAVTPEVLVSRAAELGYTSLGLTDSADLGGIVRFALQARRENIRPVIGAEINVDGCPAAFLARNAEGYRNLASLVTRARSGAVREWPASSNGTSASAKKRPCATHPPRGRPGVRWQDVIERSAGLHALTGPASGPLATRLIAGDRAGAVRMLAEWRELFGDRLAVEVQLHHAGRMEEALAGTLIALAEWQRVPWVVTNDPRYVDRGSRLVHDMLTALRANLTMDEATARGVLLPNGQWCLRSPEVMATQWSGRERGLEESARIAEQCDFDLGWLRPPLPDFPVPAGETEDSWLRVRVFEGARERWGEVGDAERRQLDHELEVIRKLGFAGFFLVMHNVTRVAHERGILCQGRGSAANSAVAYCLAITAVDPVRHGLLFERFLSEARIDGLTEAPDIDVDIEHDRREEILDYVYDNYDRSHSAITCIVQTYAAPNAVRDSMRALGYPLDMVDPISKRLHQHEPAAGAQALMDGLAERFRLRLDDRRGQALLQGLVAFDGLPRMRSTHPGGFVLSAHDLGCYLPIEPTSMGRTIVQFDKDDLDSLGIPKFDFLGLGALAQVRRAFDMIGKRTGERPSIYRLPQDDPKTFGLIARADTIGMFQIESRAQMSSLVHTRPEKMYDLVVQIALIRPGPIQAKFVKPYTLRRRGKEKVIYRHPGLARILARTEGIPIFQEQAMAISMGIAGYTAAEADELRRTMGNDRKRPRLMAALEKLRLAMVARGVEEDVAAEIAQDLESFGSYGFPESHSWSFALIAYATAYIKAHYPAEFFAGLLNAWPMGFYSPATLVHDARRHGVRVERPCLLDGEWESTVHAEGDQVLLRVGWRHIRGLAERTKLALERARASAPFVSIADVVTRAPLTASEAAALARGSAFAAWEPDRQRAGWEALRAAGDRLPLAPVPARRGVTSRPGPGSWSPAGDSYAPAPLSRDAEIELDYAALGLSPLGHPMERWRAWCERVGAVHSAGLWNCRPGTMVIVAGLVTTRQRPSTANGTIFVLLEDEHGSTNVIVSRDIDEQYREVVRHSTYLAVYGRLERDGLELNVIAKKLHTMKGGSLMHRSHDFR